MKRELAYTIQYVSNFMDPVHVSARVLVSRRGGLSKQKYYSCRYIVHLTFLRKPLLTRARDYKACIAGSMK
jgi:hypothetical protein